MAYIGSTPTTQSFISGTDYFNGTGSQTSFTLSRPVGSVNDIQAVVNNVVQVPNDAYNVSGTSIVFTSAPSAGTGNVYVRYMSTTTQSITPSQNTVSYATMNTDMQNLFGQSFTNRIINGAMVIDQRNAGASVTPTSTGYTLDRWIASVAQSSKFSVQQNAGSVTPPSGFTNYLGVTSLSAYSVISSDFFTLQQRIEGFNVADLGWGTADAKTVTLSFWVRSSLTGTFGGALRNSAGDRSYPYTYTISSANTWEQKSVTIVGDTTGTWLTNNGIGIVLSFGLGVGSTLSGTAGAWASGNFVSATGATSVVGTSGATFYITGVMLEKGSTATNYDVRPYGTELQLCQRYYYKDAREAFSMWASGVFYTTTAALVSYSLPVQMRATPTLSSSTISNFRAQGGGYVLTASALGGALSQNGGRIDFTVAGATQGQGAVIDTSSSGQFLAFSAEL
jgi:hypothetical protein